MVQAGKYRTENKSTIQTINKLNNTTEKNKQHKKTAKQNYPGLVSFHDTRPGNEMGIFDNASDPTLHQTMHTVCQPMC